MFQNIFTRKRSINSRAQRRQSVDSDKQNTSQDGQTNTHKRMGWIKRASNSGREQEVNTATLEPPAPVPPPKSSVQLDPTAVSASSSSQTPTRTAAKQPESPGPASSGRRQKGLWKGEVKSCTVIAGKLRGQLAEEGPKEETASPTKGGQTKTKQVPCSQCKKNDEIMDWREELERFRVP